MDIDPKEVSEYQFLLYRTGYIAAVYDVLNEGINHTEEKMRSWIEKYGEIPKELYEADNV